MPLDTCTFHSRGFSYMKVGSGGPFDQATVSVGSCLSTLSWLSVCLICVLLGNMLAVHPPFSVNSVYNFSNLI
jgi:hypothetical protein